VNPQRIRLGIRELVSFGQSATPAITATPAGSWRARMGTRWHQVLADEQRQLLGERLLVEVPVEGLLEHGGWQFALSGRIDQVINHSGETLLREVKTVRDLIPLPVTELEQRYPDYFEQLACYQLLWPQHTDAGPHSLPVAAEMLLVHPETGLRQTVRLQGSPAERLRLRLDRWVEFLDGRREASERVRTWQVPLPFETLREEQIPVRESLLQRYRSRETPDDTHRYLCLEAPTGFGKTSLAIEWALRALQHGHCDRIVYLTGKTTGQIPVLAELSRFHSFVRGLRFFQIRNLSAHLNLCPHSPCACAHPDRDQRHLESWIPIPSIGHVLEQGSPDAGQMAATASLHRVCPRLLSSACLGQAEIWVGDYNYAFSAGASGVLDAIPGFDPARCLLIIDEAHNLHERIASLYSGLLTARSIGVLLDEMRDHRGSRGLVSVLDRLRRLCADQNSCDLLDSRATWSLRDLLISFQDALMNGGGIGPDLSENALGILWQIADLAWVVGGESVRDLLYWVPEDGRVAITCLDASPVIHRVLQSWHQVLLMSATLPPVDTLTLHTGLRASDLCIVRAESPWRIDAYEVAVDCRVDTRYQKREQHHRTTATTLEMLVHGSSSPVVAFFPSYQYAATIAAYLEVQSPHLRCATVPRDIGSEAHSDFLENALLTQDVILLPLGGGLSEGIDTLGGRIATIMVVSPALPEVNAVQKARSARFTETGDGFREVYLVPGLTKVNQALGRIVRAPGHRARVLLHCRRFSEAQYQNLLAPEYRSPTLIRSVTDLQSWLAR
jgi:DNA excision repair protein ERCC-2